MSRHYHTATSAERDQTFALRRHAMAAGGTARPCDERAHFVEIRPCPECGQAIVFVMGGQDLGLYRCPNGHARRIQRVY